MLVERLDNEVLIRIPGNISDSRIQSIIDYLKYEELTANSKVTIEDIEVLTSEAKKGRWDKVKKEINF